MLALRVLGPLELRGDAGGASIGLGGIKPRRLLAALALYANEVVSADRLIEVVWGEAPPRSAHANLLTYVSSLRRCLAPCTGLSIEARQPGYRLLADPDSLDWQKFAAFLDDARAAHRVDPHRTVRLLREALGLWRGPVLADLAGPLAPLDARIAWLEEARLTAQVLRIDAELGIGGHAELLRELAELTAVHPLHEQLCGQHMLALYRCGRQSDALAAYHAMRRRLRDELGVDPGENLAGLYDRILHADSNLDLEPPAELPEGADVAGGTVRVAVPRQLPGRISAFTGRQEELAKLDALLAGARETVPVAAITGPPGVGKTALALHWAHQVQGRFPDGALFADLRGFSPDSAPRQPGEVLDAFLRALGTKTIPLDEGERAALLRTLLDGRQVLLVLDNAANSQQIRPLLPASPGCLVLVTSRTELTGLAVRDAAEQVPLAPFYSADAVGLLRRIIPRRRVDAEPGAAEELSRLCGGLPLALRIAAERTAARPALRLAEMTARLSAERDRLDLLTGGDDESVAVRSVFAWSYDALPIDAARMFRLLGLHPGLDFSAAAAAALGGIPAERARRLLDGLASVNLISTERDGRYLLHDLLRLYAAELATQDNEDSAQAVARLLCWYLRSADAADRVLASRRPRIELGPAPPGIAPAVFTGYDQALDWFETEEANLMAVLRLAVHTGDHATGWLLPETMFHYFNLYSCRDACLAAFQSGLASARSLGDPTAEARMLTGLGAAFRELGDHAESVALLNHSLRIRRELGDAPSIARSLAHLGETLLHQHRFADAIAPFSESLSIYQTEGDTFTAGICLASLGRAYRGLGRNREAIDNLEQAVALFTDLGESLDEATYGRELGLAYSELGEFERAYQWHQRALAIRREMGHMAGHAESLTDLGDLHASQGRHDDAVTAWHSSLEIYTRIGDHHATEVRDRLSAAAHVGGYRLPGTQLSAG